jgi:hypothetical protein
VSKRQATRQLTSDDPVAHDDSDDADNNSDEPEQPQVKRNARQK